MNILYLQTDNRAEQYYCQGTYITIVIMNLLIVIVIYIYILLSQLEMARSQKSDYIFKAVDLLDIYIL